MQKGGEKTEDGSPQEAREMGDSQNIVHQQRPTLKMTPAWALMLWVATIYPPAAVGKCSMMAGIGVGI